MQDACFFLLCAVCSSVCQGWVPLCFLSPPALLFFPLCCPLVVCFFSLLRNVVCFSLVFQLFVVAGCPCSLPFPPSHLCVVQNSQCLLGLAEAKVSTVIVKAGTQTRWINFCTRACVCVYVCVFVCACLYYIPLVTSGCVGQNIFNDFCKLRKFKQEAVKAFVGSLLRRRLPHSH